MSPPLPAGSLWGIDLGGTKIEGAIVDAARPDLALHRIRQSTESHLGYDHILDRVRVIVERLESASGIPRPQVIGIGTPGSVEPADGTMKNCNTVCLNGRPLPTDLSRALGVSVRIANDANCFALAEATLGAARGRGVVLGLILGTGVGSGIVVHGKVLEGLHGIAGEWGHNPIRGERTPCYCGRLGCVETVIAGPSLERYYRELSGQAAGLPDIVARAAESEPAACATVERLRQKFGEAIAAVINVLDPDAIVLGGGVGKVEALYEPATREAVRKYLFNPELRTELLRPVLGDGAGVFGAALLGRSGSLPA